MEYKLTINGVHFHPWAVENGIQIYPVYRNYREVTTLNGALYNTYVARWHIDFASVEISHDTLRSLLVAVQPTMYARVLPAVYTDPRGTGGATIAANVVLVSPPTYEVSRVIGGRTYYRNLTFSLEDKY